jgi:drug/metabolite transporter (DMT)-like permease
VLSFLFLLPIAIFHVRHISKKHFLYLTISGFVGSLLPALLFAKAQTVIDSGLAGTLNSLTPLFTLLMGLVFFKLQTRWYNVLGVFIAMLGAIALIYVNSESGFIFNFKYAFLVIIATLCYAFNVNFIKTYLKELKSLVITTFSFFYIGIPLTVYVLLFSEIPYKLITNTETIKGLGYLLILSIAGTGLALIFFNKLIKVSSPVFASSVTYLIPIVAIIWGVIDGESFHLLYFLCFLLILSGIFLINITPYSNLNISSWFVFRKKRK